MMRNVYFLISQSAGAISDLQVLYLDHYLFCRPLLRLVDSYSDFRILFGLARSVITLDGLSSSSKRTPPKTTNSLPQGDDIGDKAKLSSSGGRPGTSSSIRSSEIDELVEQSIHEFAEKDDFTVGRNLSPAVATDDVRAALSLTESGDKDKDHPVASPTGDDAAGKEPVSTGFVESVEPPPAVGGVPVQVVNEGLGPKQTPEELPLPLPPLRFKPAGRAAVMRRRLNILKSYPVEVR